MKLLIAAMFFGVVSIPSAMYGDNIKVTTGSSGSDKGGYGGNDNPEEHYPHRAPAHYSNEAAAYWNAETGLLSVSFYSESDEVTISIYKDDELIEETFCPVSYGDVVNFDLSSYGNGDYQIVISGLADDDLYGYFSK